MFFHGGGQGVLLSIRPGWQDFRVFGFMISVITTPLCPGKHPNRHRRYVEGWVWLCSNNTLVNKYLGLAHGTEWRTCGMVKCLSTQVLGNTSGVQIPPLFLTCHVSFTRYLASPCFIFLIYK